VIPTSTKNRAKARLSHDGLSAGKDGQLTYARVWRTGSGKTSELVIQLWAVDRLASDRDMVEPPKRRADMLYSARWPITSHADAVLAHAASCSLGDRKVGAR